MRLGIAETAILHHGTPELLCSATPLQLVARLVCARQDLARRMSHEARPSKTWYRA